MPQDFQALYAGHMIS